MRGVRDIETEKSTKSSSILFNYISSYFSTRPSWYNISIYLLGVSFHLINSVIVILQNDLVLYLYISIHQNDFVLYLYISIDLLIIFYIRSTRAISKGIFLRLYHVGCGSQMTYTSHLLHVLLTLLAGSEISLSQIHYQRSPIYTPVLILNA